MIQTDPHPPLTLTLQIWAGLGPLVGLVAGHIMTRTWQHKQWLLDNRKQEFRELTSTIGQASIDLMFYMLGPAEGKVEAGERWITSQRAAMVCISDRIFIRDDIEKLKVRDRFLGATMHFNDVSVDIAKQLDAIIDDLVITAM